MLKIRQINIAKKFNRRQSTLVDTVKVKGIISMLFCHIKFWTNNGDSSDAAARVELISSQHDKDISRVGTLFITQVTSKANPCVRP